MTTIRWSRVHIDSTHELLLDAEGVSLIAGDDVQRWTIGDLTDGAANAVILSDMGLDVLAEVSALASDLELIDAIDTTPAPERRRHERIYGGGRGGTWTVWFFGHRVRFSARELEGTREATLEELVKDGLPEGFDDICGEEQATRILTAARDLAPLECMCGTGCQTPDQHGSMRRLSSARDPRAPYDVTAEVVRCEVCQRWWTFEERGDSHYGYQRNMKQFIPARSQGT